MGAWLCPGLLAVELPAITRDIELAQVIAVRKLVMDILWYNAGWSDEERAVYLPSNFGR